MPPGFRSQTLGTLAAAFLLAAAKMARKRQRRKKCAPRSARRESAGALAGGGSLRQAGLRPGWRIPGQSSSDPRPAL